MNGNSFSSHNCIRTELRIFDPEYRAMRDQKARKKTEPKILACADCGVYIPESEAIRHHGRVYCSSVHAENHEV